MLTFSILVLLSAGLLGSTMLSVDDQDEDNEVDVASDGSKEDDTEIDSMPVEASIKSDLAGSNLGLEGMVGEEEPVMMELGDSATGLPTQTTSSESKMLHGSNGNDFLEPLGSSESEKNYLGLNGDDFIRTSAVLPHEGFNAVNLHSNHLSGGANSAFGGAGDDTIEFSMDDFAEGGAGNDTFILIADVLLNDDPAEISDFEKNHDRVIVQVDQSEAFIEENPDQNDLFKTVGRYTDGDDEIFTLGGKPILSVATSQGLSIGIQSSTANITSPSELTAITTSQAAHLLDLDGNAIYGPLPDIIFTLYPKVV